MAVSPRAEPLLPAHSQTLSSARPPQSAPCFLDTDNIKASNNRKGLACTTAAALLFGVVAAMVKDAALPPLAMLLARALVQWVLSVAVVMLTSGLRTQRQDFIGPPSVRVWLLMRAALYFAFQACWWSALLHLPLGDATSLVYMAPIFTMLFSFVLLKEPFRCFFFEVFAADCLGVFLICQPAGAQTDQVSYFEGVTFALLSALAAGLLPVAVRKSNDVHWSTIEHVTSAGAIVLFAPISIAIWCAVDETAVDALVESLRSRTWPLLLAASGIEFAGLGLQTVGYQRVANAATASLINTVEVPFAFFLQASLFGVVLGARFWVALAGSVLIVVANAATVLDAAS